MEYMEITEATAERSLNNAQNYADVNSTCAKVKVGSMILGHDGEVMFGCNHGVCNCVKNGCRRIKLYGENSKEHRLPSDCDAIHSEVDAISKAAKVGMKLSGATIFVTRYPCENCARAIAQAGITTVIYGRREDPSEYTRQILDDSGVKCFKLDTWNREDNNV